MNILDNKNVQQLSMTEIGKKIQEENFYLITVYEEKIHAIYYTGIFFIYELITEEETCIVCKFCSFTDQSVQQLFPFSLHFIESMKMCSKSEFDHLFCQYKEYYGNIRFSF